MQIVKQVAMTVVSPLFTLAAMLVLLATTVTVAGGMGIFLPFIFWADHQMSTSALLIYFAIYSCAMSAHLFYWYIPEVAFKLASRGVNVLLGAALVVLVTLCVMSRFGLF